MTHLLLVLLLTPPDPPAPLWLDKSPIIDLCSEVIYPPELERDLNPRDHEA